MAKSRRVDKMSTEGGSELGQGIELPGLTAASSSSTARPAERVVASPREPRPRFRGRLELRRETAGRGGKAVTTVTGQAWVQSPQREREALFAELRRQCACGGKLTKSGFEIQGDQRDTVEQRLKEAGFQVVRAGG